MALVNGWSRTSVGYKPARKTAGRNWAGSSTRRLAPGHRCSICHQKADRVKAHILVCFVAYVLWKTLAQWMHRAGLGDAPRTLLQELAKIKSGDVVLPARGRGGQPDKRIRLRCVVTPDPAQKVLLDRLGLTLPQRLRRIDEIVQM